MKRKLGKIRQQMDCGGNCTLKGCYFMWKCNCEVNVPHVKPNSYLLMFSTWQASAEDKHFTKYSKRVTFWNFMTIFGITMGNAFK